MSAQISARVCVESVRWCPRTHHVSLSVKTKQALQHDGRSDEYEIRQAGIKIAIASAGKHARLILQRLALTDCFDGIADRYSICNNKPAPDIFLFAAGLVNVPVSGCLAIDDKAPNLAEIKRTGMRVLGIGEKEHFHPGDPVLPSLAHVCLQDILCCAVQRY